MVGSWKARLDSDNMQEETGSNTTTQTSTVTYLLLVFAMLYGTLRQRRLSTTRLSVWIDFFDKHSRRKRSRTPHGPFGADLLVYALAFFLRLQRSRQKIVCSCDVATEQNGFRGRTLQFAAQASISIDTVFPANSLSLSRQQHQQPLQPPVGCLTVQNVSQHRKPTTETESCAQEKKRLLQVKVKTAK